MVKSGYLQTDEDESAEPVEEPTVEDEAEWREAWEEYATGPGSLDEEALPDEGDGEDDVAGVL